MSKVFKSAIILSSIMLVVACKKEEPPAPVVPPPPPAPPVAPVEEPPVDTDTGTGTEPELPPVEEPASKGTMTPVTRASLIGNYTCSISSSEFPMGISPPPAICKISEGPGDSLQISPIGNLGVSGRITNIKGTSFSISGDYNVGVGKLKLNARLKKRSGRVYRGSGKGSLDDAAAISFNLTLKKK